VILNSKPRRAALALGCIAFLTGCGSKVVDVDDPRSCFPEAARSWIHATAAAKPAETRKADAATVYVDRSGSMVGYINGATASARPLQDLIGNLPAMLSAQQVGTRFKAFGTSISQPLTQAEQGSLMQPAYYTCAKGGACDNQESRLDSVFKEIAANKQGMALVVTDLWFSNSDIQTSALSALAEPLAEILSTDRAVAIYGISAPFDGQIYDLPYASAPMRFKGEHPLFVIAVGSNEQIAGLHESWKRAPSPYLAEELSGGRVKRTLFTLNPAAKSEALASPLSETNHPALSQEAVLESHEGLRLQEFVLNADSAFRPAPGTTAPQWKGPSASAFIPDSVWDGRFDTKTRVWERRDTACTDADWLEAAPLNGLWSGEGAGPRTFTLNPERLATELGRAGTYLVTGEVVRTEVASPNPASEWIRKWSFAPGNSSPARQGENGTAFFPTLHLSEAARLLENALATASRRRPAPVVGFAVAVKVDR
jgi:hypothetical protein